MAMALVASALVVGLHVFPLGGGASPAQAVAQNDAQSGGDASNLFATATPVASGKFYSARLDRSAGDTVDFFKIPVRAGEAFSVLVTFNTLGSEPVTLLDPTGRPVDTGTAVANVGMSASNAMTTESSGLRLAEPKALVGGDYRLQLTAQTLDVRSYSFCFMNCETPVKAPIDMIFGGSLPTAHTKVLLVPPTTGDLGNPAGPTALDYLAATQRGIHKWVAALRSFATDYPQYGYLANIDVAIEVFDGLHPVDPVGYDVVLGYVAAGPAFRGIASQNDPFEVSDTLRKMGLEDTVRYTGRVILLSLYGSSPRAGQVGWDFPEVTDLETVTMHEFAHTFGLGHTRTIDPALGPDLMNSPATFIYGDGFSAGDGGEHTPLGCISSLDLYGMAQLYRWLPTGNWAPSYNSVSLPSSIKYQLYC
ncbi:MAG TPA: hypothetical protein VNB24_03725 [Acidimicrobiales bacterium]|nr:hypothetical protein [Acidimicrobiales bacterium]